jgi:predicted  nucleic acid-binding Zn-ribbon protein
MTVKEQLKSLIELQQIDSKILDTKKILDKIPLKISEAEVSLKESLATLDSIKQKLSSLEKVKRDKERQLDDIIEKLNKLKARFTEIKTNKEYQAYLKEIESIEKDRYSIEDEILIIMEEIDNISRQIVSEEEKLKKERDKIESFKKNLWEEKSEVEKELITAKEMRTKIVETIDEELYNQYINLIETYNGLAVAEAENEICQGCNMNIPPQLFVELKKNEEIIHCPQCRRILYYKNNK